MKQSASRVFSKISWSERYGLSWTVIVVDFEEPLKGTASDYLHSFSSLDFKFRLHAPNMKNDLNAVFVVEPRRVDHTSNTTVLK